MGYEIKVFHDIQFQTLRRTGSKYDPRLYFYYGLGMKAIGYIHIFAIGRILKFALKKPRGAYFMLRGFLSDFDNLYEPEVRNYVRHVQYNKIKSLFTPFFRNFTR